MPICREACSASLTHVPDTRTGWLCADSSCRHRMDVDWFGAHAPGPHKSDREGAVCHPPRWASCSRHRDTRHLHKEWAWFDEHSMRENLSHRWLCICINACPYRVNVCCFSGDSIQVPGPPLFSGRYGYFFMLLQTLQRIFKTVVAYNLLQGISLFRWLWNDQIQLVCSWRSGSFEADAVL